MVHVRVRTRHTDVSHSDIAVVRSSYQHFTLIRIDHMHGCVSLALTFIRGRRSRDALEQQIRPFRGSFDLADFELFSTNSHFVRKARFTELTVVDFPLN